jgi:AraC-like DNA-binding protein
MIDLADLDMMTRGGSIALLALWGWILIRDHRASLAARIAVAMIVAIVGHVIATIPHPVHTHGLVDLFIQLAGAAVPGLFWLFARTWFNDEPVIGWPSWLLIGAGEMLVGAQIVAHVNGGALSVPIGIALRSLMFGFAASGLWIAWRGRDGDLVETRRGFRTRFVGAVGAYVILVNGGEIGMYLGWFDSGLGRLMQSGVLLLCFAFAAAMFGMRQGELFAPARGPAPIAKPAAPLELSQLAARLHTHMAEQKPYRDETLTIAALAAQLGEQEYRLRRVINGELGHRNFSSFLNGYRLGEVKAALRDPSQNEVPILTVALDAGFGSLGPFNRAFREAEGCTPSEFRAAGAG